MKWREEGLDYFDALIRHGHQRGKEIWWGLRMNEIERGDLTSYDTMHGAPPVSPDVRNPVKAAHPGWLIRSWWWQGFWGGAWGQVCGCPNPRRRNRPSAYRGAYRGITSISSLMSDYKFI
jgi:hypothetical protein